MASHHSADSSDGVSRGFGNHQATTAIGSQSIKTSTAISEQDKLQSQADQYPKDTHNHKHPQDLQNRSDSPTDASATVNLQAHQDYCIDTPVVLKKNCFSPFELFKITICILDIYRFISQIHANGTWKVTALMTAHIGTEMSGNNKSSINFTTKTSYMAVKKDGSATLSRLSLDKKQNTTTVTRFLKLEHCKIHKLAGTKLQSESAELDAVLYLYTNKQQSKTYIGLFLVSIVKYKALISFGSNASALRMAKFFRTSQCLLSFGLSAHVFVVIFMLQADCSENWYSSIATRACQITIQPDQTGVASSIEGFVTEMLPAVGNKRCALSAVVTEDHHIHLYEIEQILGKQPSTKSSRIGVYKIDFESLLSTLQPAQISGLDIKALALVDLFLLQPLNNKLVLVYASVSATAVDILVLQSAVQLENKEKQQEHIEANNSLKRQTAFKKNRAERAAQRTCMLDSVLMPFAAHRLTFNDRDRLGPDWQQTKVLVSEVKVVDNKVCMMVSSTSLKIQELVILDGQNLTHFSIKDETNQGVASIDSLQVWHSKPESTLHVLTQSITEKQTAVRDLSFDIKLASSPQ